MGMVEIAEEVQSVIDRQVAEGRAPDADAFLAQAVLSYVDLLDAYEDEIVAAIDEGIADIEAGRCERFETAADLLNLRKALDARLDSLVEQASAMP